MLFNALLYGGTLWDEDSERASKRESEHTSGRKERPFQYVFSFAQNYFSFAQNLFSFAQNLFSFAQNYFSFAQNYFSFDQNYFSFPQNYFSFSSSYLQVNNGCFNLRFYRVKKVNTVFQKRKRDY